MLDPENLRITHFIAHLFDQETDGYQLSSAETPIGPGSGFPYDFFNEYVRYPLRDQQGRMARFTAPGEGTVGKAFADLRASKVDFVQASRTIAAHLDRVINTYAYKTLIQPGDLMVAQLAEGGSPGDGEPGPTAAGSHLAIFKVRPSDAIVRRVMRSSGKQWVVFSRDARLPAAADNEVQKIAVLSHPRQTDPEPFDLVILDRNLGEKRVARFFFGAFLESELNADPLETRRHLLDTVQKLLGKKTPRVDAWTPHEMLEVVQRAHDALGVPKWISPDEVAKRAVVLPDRPPGQVARLREAFVEMLAADTRPDKRIEPTQRVRVAAPAVVMPGGHRTLTLDEGVKISGDPDAVKALVEYGGQDEQGYTILTIRTKTFRVT